MKAAWVVGSVIIMLSCGTFLRGSSRPTLSSASPVVLDKACAPCPRQQALEFLRADLEHCEAEVVTLGEAPVKVKHVPVEKIVVKVEKRYCADEGPVIEPVLSTKCIPGQLCLDDEGQRVLAKNLASYAAWVNRVKDCEAK